jgi:hypothetical protein
MTARVRPLFPAPMRTRYFPAARGFRFRGLGDDGDGTDSTGAFLNLPSFISTGDPTNPFTVPSSTVGSGEILNLPAYVATGDPTNPFTPVTTSSSSVASSGGSTTPSSPTKNWAQVLNSAVAAAGKIGQQLTNPLFNLPPGTYAQVGPGGTVVATAGATIPASNPLASLTSSSMLPLLLLGGGLLVVVMMAGKK